MSDMRVPTDSCCCYCYFFFVIYLFNVYVNRWMFIILKCDAKTRPYKTFWNGKSTIFLLLFFIAKTDSETEEHRSKEQQQQQKRLFFWIVSFHSISLWHNIQNNGTCQKRGRWTLFWYVLYHVLHIYTIFLMLEEIRTTSNKMELYTMCTMREDTTWRYIKYKTHKLIQNERIVCDEIKWKEKNCRLRFLFTVFCCVTGKIVRIFHRVL